MGDIIFHIGFPKTATTTLQSVLMQCESCAYVGKGLREALEPSISLDVARAVLFADTRRFEEAAPDLARRLAAMAEEKTCLVVSDEAFSFAEHMKIGRQWGRQVVTDHAVIAARLAQLAPEARIMMSVRHQLSFLQSFYRQSIKGDGFEGSFDDYISHEIAALPHRSMLHLLRFDETYDAYAARFDAGRILVSCYEAYIRDFGLYLDETAEFCGLQAAALREIWGGRHDNKAKRARPNKEVEALIRLVPPMLRKAIPEGPKKALKRKTSRPPEPAEFTEAQRTELVSWFAPSNQALVAATGLDLAAHDYPGLSGAPRQTAV